MYRPAAFVEPRLEANQALIEAHPLGLLIGVDDDGVIEANALPFLIDRAVPPFGRLSAHLARANPQWRTLVGGRSVLVVFQGPASYVSPSWYPSKREHGKVVPTWNYIMVQVRGVVQVIDDGDWLEDQVNALTRRHERTRAAPWEVDDAPRPFIDAMKRGIVGLEIDITAIDGKWKASQNRSEADRQGVAAGLDASSDPAALAMAELVRQLGPG
jgi:transcriptional regulator